LLIVKAKAEMKKSKSFKILNFKKMEAKVSESFKIEFSRTANKIKIIDNFAFVTDTCGAMFYCKLTKFGVKKNSWRNDY